MNLTFKKILFLIVINAVCQTGRGQPLLQIVINGNIKDDTTKIRTFNKIGYRYMYLLVQNKSSKYRDSSLLAYDEALKIANQLKTADKTFWQMTVVSAIGELAGYAGDTTGGRRKLLNAINFFKKNKNENEELNCWRILSKTAEYYGKLKDMMAYLRIIEKRSIQYHKLGMLVTTKARIIETIGMTGHIDTVKGLYIKLINEYKHANIPELDYVYGQLAIYYRNRGDLSKALQYALAAESWMSKPRDTLSKSKSSFYGELAEIYQLLGQSEKSIEWYKKAITVRLKMDIMQVYIYRTVGFVVQEYIKQKKIHEALVYVNDFSKKYPPVSPDNEASLWQMKAYCFEALGKFDMAEHAYLEMIIHYNLAHQGGEIMLLADYDIGKFYINRKQYKKAAAYINHIDLTNWTAFEKKDYHYLFFKIDSANKNYLSAIRHFNLYKETSDSIFNATKSRQIAEIQVNNDIIQQQLAITTLRKESSNQAQQVKQANKIKNLSTAAALLLLLVAGLLYYGFKTNKKANDQIKLTNESLNGMIQEKDALLLEKEWLMKEIHHRVKNNLQIVMGLLQRQSAFINNKEALAAIRNSEQRMQSIALIHQKLYQSENFTSVSMTHYIDEMINYLRECFDTGERILFEKKIDDLEFEVNMAVSIGLILNEAITNSIKYAFPAGRRGHIKIVLAKLGIENYLLEVADDGIGLNNEFKPDQINTMGFNLMRGLSKQLGGKLMLANDRGLVVSVNFQTA